MKLWDLRLGELRCTFRGHGNGVTCVAFGAGNRLAFSGSYDGTMKVWDLAAFSDRKLRNVLRLAQAEDSVEFDTQEAQYTELLRQVKSRAIDRDVSHILDLVRQARAIPGREFLTESLDAWRNAGRYCRRVRLCPNESEAVSLSIKRLDWKALQVGTRKREWYARQDSNL